MEGLKHTEGPWRYEKGDEECHPDQHFVCWNGTGCEETTICETHYGEHDARLIAAAPDMLEALMLAYEELLNIARLHDWHSETFRVKIEKITTAIEKATGAKIDEVTARLIGDENVDCHYYAKFKPLTKLRGGKQ